MRKIYVLTFVCLFLLFLAGCGQNNSATTEKTDDFPPENVDNPHQHSWDNGTVTKVADCKDGGVIVYLCQCGGIKTETTPATSEHNWSEGVAQEDKIVYTCPLCSAVKTEDSPSTSQEPDVPDTPDAPTEPDEPIQPDAPTEPDEPTQPDIPPPHEHSWDSGIVTLSPTCKTEGITTYSCDCGEKKAQSIPVISEHSWNNGEAEGNTQIFTCTVCGNTKTVTIEVPETPTTPNTNEGDAITSSPAPYPVLLKPSADGKSEKRNNLAVIDFSNASEGYVMAQYTDATDKRLKVQVKHGEDTYTYNITPQSWAVFPLSEGSGEYKITVYRQTEGTKYATILSHTITADLKNDFSTFLYPNQYVDYSVAPNTIDKAYELTKFITDPLQKVAAIYDFVVDTISYDKNEAATVQSGYLPVLDEVLETKTGICFDYAALMTGMLRSQGIPCKLVVGYAGKAYHAWINVWTEESGWVDGVIFFDGVKWQRMDPTFASSSNRSDSIMEYIGDGSNYTEKYLY